MHRTKRPERRLQRCSMSSKTRRVHAYIYISTEWSRGHGSAVCDPDHAPSALLTTLFFWRKLAGLGSPSLLAISRNWSEATAQRKFVPAARVRASCPRSFSLGSASLGVSCFVLFPKPTYYLTSGVRIRGVWYNMSAGTCFAVRSPPRPIHSNKRDGVNHSVDFSSPPRR